MTEWLLPMAGSTLRWLAGWLLDSIGWGGVAALLCGLFLLLSLSARTARFLTSPKGMAVTAAGLVLALGGLWWFRPEAAEPPSVATPKPALPKMEPMESPKLAMKEPVADEPDILPEKAKPKPLDPLLTMPVVIPPIETAALTLPPPPPVAIPKPGTHAGSAVAAHKQPAHHKAPAKSHAAANSATRQAVAPRAMPHASLSLGQGIGHPAATPANTGQHPAPGHSPKQTAAQQWAVHDQQMTWMFGHLMENQAVHNGIHPMNNMGHPMSHPMTHPTPAAGHPAGHVIGGHPLGHR